MKIEWSTYSARRSVVLSEFIKKNKFTTYKQLSEYLAARNISPPLEQECSEFMDSSTAVAPIAQKESDTIDTADVLLHVKAVDHAKTSLVENNEENTGKQKTNTAPTQKPKAKPKPKAKSKSRSSSSRFQPRKVKSKGK